MIDKRDQRLRLSVGCGLLQVVMSLALAFGFALSDAGSLTKVGAVTLQDEERKERPAEASEADEPSPLDELNEAGFSKLHYAAMHNKPIEASELLAGGANVNVRQGTFRGTPLQYAAFNGHDKLAQMLIQSDAELDATDSIGRTPLMWAAHGGRASVVKRLVAAGAEVNARTDKGWTALMYARQAGDQLSVQLLLDGGASDEPKTSAASAQPLPASEVAARLKRYRKEVEFLSIASSKIPAGYRVAESLPAVVIPGASPTDDAYFNVVAAFVGKSQAVREQVDAAIIIGFTSSPPDAPISEIGVYALRCKSEKIASEWARPGLIQKGPLLLYIWKDNAAAAFDTIRDHYLEQEFETEIDD